VLSGGYILLEFVLQRVNWRTIWEHTKVDGSVLFFRGTVCYLKLIMYVVFFPSMLFYKWLHISHGIFDHTNIEQFNVVYETVQ
jgi:hypothetical protein